jgi:hypothetical protein
MMTTTTHTKKSLRQLEASTTVSLAIAEQSVAINPRMGSLDNGQSGGHSDFVKGSLGRIEEMWGLRTL